jgi:MFS family permease
MTDSKNVLTTRSETRFFYGYLIVAVSFFVLLVIWGTYYTFGIFFKPVLKDFGWTRAMTSGAFSVSSIMNGLIGIAMGGLNDRFGPRLVMTFCGLFLTLGYFLMSQLNDIWQLYVFYGVIIGAGMGGSFTPLLSTVARWFVLRRGLMTGIVTAGIGIGALVGPPAVDHFISIFDWRTSYVILACIILAAIVLPVQLIKRDPSDIGEMAYGEKTNQQKGQNIESKTTPFREAASTSKFWLVLAVQICAGFCVFAVMVHIAPHATELKISSSAAAKILATIGGISILGKLVFGKAADKIGSKNSFMISFVMMLLGFVWLFSAHAEWMLYVFACVFGIAYGGCVVSISPLVAELFGLISHGLILGVQVFGFTVGGAIGPFLVGYIYDLRSSYHLAFLICSAISFLGLLIILLLKFKKGT